MNSFGCFGAGFQGRVLNPRHPLLTPLTTRWQCCALAVATQWIKHMCAHMSCVVLRRRFCFAPQIRKKRCCGGWVVPWKGIAARNQRQESQVKTCSNAARWCGPGRKGRKIHVCTRETPHRGSLEIITGFLWCERKCHRCAIDPQTTLPPKDDRNNCQSWV